jgi:hypothetical protein
LVEKVKDQWWLFIPIGMQWKIIFKNLINYLNTRLVKLKTGQNLQNGAFAQKRGDSGRPA